MEDGKPLIETGPEAGRSIGLLGATGIGVGAIVGGGVLALAGVAFVATGPGAMAAFALNGLIAALTALSFAEMAAAFPESGGTYTFAKKVLTAQAAFMVGWVVWLASILAGVLYALGFASYARLAAAHVWAAYVGSPPAWLEGRLVVLGLALAATAFYALSLTRRSAGGGQWATVGKVVVFAVLIAGGLWALTRESPDAVLGRLEPFFPNGGLGLVQAMGFTFIALQGFDLIAAVGGEVRRPRKNIPRAMLLSLAAALGIYLPLLFIIATVGVEPGGSITGLSAEDPGTVIATAAGRFLGPFGFWLVIVAALLSMLSALHANILAASRVALTMASDRALPRSWARLHDRRRTPGRAILATTLLMVAILLIVADVESAGAASSLIFLVSFALAHGTSILARRRGGVREGAFRVPWFPLVPAVGGLACLALALFQGIAVPSAGLIAGLWLSAGFALYFLFFAPGAGAVDASAEARDPDLVRLRGRAPLVLAPIARPSSARALAEVANALAPPRVGRVLLLSVLQPPGLWSRGDLRGQLEDVQEILDESMTLSLEAGNAPELLTTVAADPWEEIGRVAREHRCESLLLGLGDLSDEDTARGLEEQAGAIGSDVVILRAPEGWSLGQVERVLVPVGGRRDQSALRARLLGSLCREGGREVRYLRILAAAAPPATVARARREVAHLARDEVPEGAEAALAQAADVMEELVDRASGSDLVVLGLRRLGRRRRVFGDMVLRLARATSCPLLLIGRR